MAIPGGSILHSAGNFVLDRVQSAGPGDLNIPEEKIYELGNFESVETVRDNPELTFDLESLDMTTEVEALLIGEDPTSFPTTPGTNEIDFRDAVPIDILSPLKSRRNRYNIIRGAIMPYLTLESVTYRFGVGENSTQSFSLRGDSVFYIPGQPWYEEIANTGVGPYTLDESPAIEYTQGQSTLYVLSVMLYNPTTGNYKRLFHDSSGLTGYNDTASALTLAEDESADYPVIRITYGVDADTFDYTQTGNTPNGTPVHQDVAVKPGAIRGKDIEIWVGTAGATPIFKKFSSVQNVEATWSAPLENDEELGNPRYVSTDYDVPEVTGNIGLKPFDPADLFDKLEQVTGVPQGEVIGPNLTQTIPVEVRIHNPNQNGARLKTIYIPDARFTVPGYSGQANTKLETTMNFSSDKGLMYVYNGVR